MMKIFNALILLLLSTVSMAYECIGPKDAKTVVVYLHGMDTANPGGLEQKNREALTKIAYDLHIGFAIPRAKDKCPTQPNLLCWGWNFKDQKTIDTALSEGAKAKEFCFPNADHAGLLGFSNGGYVVNYALKSCSKRGFDWSISVGAGSTWNEPGMSDHSGCGPYVFMAGKQDGNLKTVNEMKPWLVKNKADFKIVEFNGAHEVPYKELEEQLKILINSVPESLPRTSAPVPARTGH